MATIYSTAEFDGYIRVQNASTWAGARDATDGTGHSRSDTKSFFAIRTSRASARGGGYVYTIYRSFLTFNTHSISIAPSEAVLRIYGNNANAADMFVVKSTHALEFGNDDFDSITGWTSGDNESNVTKYSAEITSWSTSGYNDITLTADARADMVSLSEFKVCLIESVHDLRDVTPSTNDSNWSGMYYSDQTGTSNDPYIDYVAGTAAVADNATFFGANF